MELTLLGTPSPIYLVGESHTLIFRNLLCRAENGQLFQSRIRYLPHVLAQNFFTSAVGSHHPDLADALRSEGLLRPDFTPAHKSLDGASVSGAWMEKRAIVAPVLVMCIGDLDIHHLLTQFADYDFELPGDLHYGVDRSKRPIAYFAVAHQMEKLLAPFIDGLRALRAIGFSRTMVHCVPPRTADDHATLRWTKVHKSVRAKVTVIANQILARACATLGVPFIDIWPDTSQDGYLLPQYDLDGTHLTQAAALLSLSKIVSNVYRQTWNTHNGVRYSFAMAQAPQYTHEPASVLQPAQDIHIAKLEAPVHLLEAALDDYQAPALTVTGMDWCATPVGSRGALLSAKPTAEQLALAAQLLGEGPGHAALHAGVNFSRTISSLRPSRIAAGSAPVLLARTNDGEGLCKAILRLGGEGVIAFANSAGEVQHIMSAEAGTLAIYNPANTSCVLDPAHGDISVLEISLIPQGSGQPFRVVWSGLNEWPLDPFQYSVDGMLAHPPFDTQQVTIRAVAFD